MVQHVETLVPDDALEALRGVGPAMARHLAASGLHTVRDLLLCFPRRLRELQELERLESASVGRWVRLHGVVEGADLQFIGRRRSIVTVRLRVDGDEVLRVALFNRKHRTLYTIRIAKLPRRTPIV